MTQPLPFRAFSDRGLASSIRLVGLDVDGVMTDGGIFLGEAGGQPIEFKRYEIQDGLGIKLLQRAGMEVAVITGRVSRSVEMRAAELGIEACVQDPHARKLVALRDLAGRRGIPLEAVAFVGDDLPDVGVLRAVGLPVVVANASPTARTSARYILERRGGEGAIREFAEILLEARGQWDDLVKWYVASREEAVVP